MVGAGTVIADDPQLSARIDGYGGPQPRPVVVLGERELPPSAAVLERHPLIYSTRPAHAGQDVVIVPGDGPRIDLRAVAKDLAERGLLYVVVEGGPTLASSLVGAGLVSHITAYFGPLIAGGVGRPAIAGVWRTLPAALRLEYHKAAAVGESIRIDARVVS
jgi:diaminohydroxyphosphoribosylaminopyrimidine deaminase/5-amino-6-(5-phosphoribosylamino)uracil reductase